MEASVLGCRMVVLSKEERLGYDDKGRKEAKQGLFRDKRMRSILLFVFKSDRFWRKNCEWCGVIGLEEWRNDYGGGYR